MTDLLYVQWLNFFYSREMFWPIDVTYGELHGAANNG